MSISEFFNWVLYTSFVSSIIVVLVLLVRALLRNKLGHKWKYYLWFLVLIKLVVPYTPQSPISMLNLFSVKNSSDSIVHEVENQSSQPLVELEYQDVEMISLNNPNDSSKNYEELSTIHSINNQYISSKSKENVQESRLRIIPLTWLIISILFFMYILILNMKIIVRLRKIPEVSDCYILDTLESCKLKMGLKTKLSVKKIDVTNSPSLYGVFRPCLLLPGNTINELSLEELEYIFLHELGHLKRKDTYINCIIIALQVLHWFNPIIWYAFIKMTQDREIACDALVISNFSDDKKRKYGKTLINLVRNHTSAKALLVSVGILEKKSLIRRRIEMISLFKKSTLKQTIIALVFMILLGCTTLTGPSSNQFENQELSQFVGRWEPIEEKDLVSYFYSVEFTKDGRRQWYVNGKLSSGECQYKVLDDKTVELKRKVSFTNEMTSSIYNYTFSTDGKELTLIRPTGEAIKYVKCLDDYTHPEKLKLDKLDDLITALFSSVNKDIVFRINEEKFVLVPEKSKLVTARVPEGTYQGDMAAVYFSLYKGEITEKNLIKRCHYLQDVIVDNTTGEVRMDNSNITNMNMLVRSVCSVYYDYYLSVSHKDVSSVIISNNLTDEEFTKYNVEGKLTNNSYVSYSFDMAKEPIDIVLGFYAYSNSMTYDTARLMNIHITEKLLSEKIKQNIEEGKSLTKSRDLINFDSESSSIIIFNTHPFEKYNTGEKVTDYAKLLQKKLQVKGFNVIYLENSNSIFEESYPIARNILLNSIDDFDNNIFLDIHRDGISEEHRKTIISPLKNEVNFVLGGKNPHYEENKSLAVSIAEEINKYDDVNCNILTSGLGNFNQDLSGNMLLVSLGNQHTSKENLNRSIDVIAETFENIFINQ